MAKKPESLRPEFYCQTGSMFENPYGVPHAKIRRMLDTMTPEVSAQVIFGKYVDNSGLVFIAELVNQLFDRSLGRVRGDRYVDEAAARQSLLDRTKWEPSPSRWGIGVDLARKKDSTVITVLDTVSRPARVVYWRRTSRVPWPTIYAEIGRALHLFPGELLIDSTGSGGDIVLEALEDSIYCPAHHVAFIATEPCPGPGRYGTPCRADAWRRYAPEGFQFTAQSKRDLVNHLQACLGADYHAGNNPDFGAIRCPPITQLEAELAEYSWEDKKLDTDCVFSLALAAWQALEQQLADPLVGSVYGG